MSEIRAEVGASRPHPPTSVTFPDIGAVRMVRGGLREGTTAAEGA
jgi:hypothetical protein